MAKSGAMPARPAYSRSRAEQKLWMVPICARRTSALSRRSRFEPGSAAARAESSSEMRLRSSAAAAVVKVMMRKLSMLRGASPSVIQRMSRSVSTRVLPLPAAAETSSSPPRSSMASSCDGVGLNSAIFRASFQHVPHARGAQFGQIAPPVAALALREAAGLGVVAPEAGVVLRALVAWVGR